jgi:hypothetical protein
MSIPTQIEQLIKECHQGLAGFSKFFFFSKSWILLAKNPIHILMYRMITVNSFNSSGRLNSESLRVQSPTLAIGLTRSDSEFVSWDVGIGQTNWKGLIVHCNQEFKRTVSRDFHICFRYHSIDLKFLHLIEPFFCFLNFVFVSDFSIFANQRSELTYPVSGAGIYTVNRSRHKVKYDTQCDKAASSEEQ